MIHNRIYMLDPAAYSAAAEDFGRHFHITPGSAGMPLLRKLVSSFSSIPYENISKIVKHRRAAADAGTIRLPEELLTGYIRDNLGGTCFSLTFFLDCILRHYGFSCYPVSADMRSGANLHCALITVLDSGKYLLDPGYLINDPVLIDRRSPVFWRSPSSGISFHYYDACDDIDLHTFNRQGSTWRYRFRDKPLAYGRFLEYWLNSFTRNSMNALCLNRRVNGCMTYINRTRLRLSSDEEIRTVNIQQTLYHTIQRHFGIEPHLVEEALSLLS